MVETTLPPADAAPPDGLVTRFDAAERNVHWWTAALVGMLALTSLALSVAPVSTLVGRRDLVKEIHVISGLLLPLPFLVGRLGPWSRRLRADIRRLSRFDALDQRWLRSLGRDPYVTYGKFHPGQKLNAAVVGGALVLMLATGVVMKWFGPFPLPVRRGATFVHDWTAFLLAFDLIAHIGKALADPDALRGMVTGRVSRRWAARRHPRWDQSA